MRVRIERDVVTAVGPDALTFLQGQLSQDVEAIAVGGSAWSLLLHPDGKVVAWLRVTRTGDDSVLLDTDAGAGAAVLARLQRFKLRTKCDLAAEARGFVAVRARGGVAPESAGATVLPIVWPGVDGYDVLLDGAADAADTDNGGSDDDGLAAYEALRIEAGVPAVGRELTDRTIPAEAGQWLIDASASFAKGCYTGQELVARIDSRGGNVPRPIRGLVFAGDAPVPPPGATVAHDGRDVGVVTSAARSRVLDAPVALGPVGRAVPDGAALVVSWDDGASSAPAHLAALPLVP